MVGNRPVDLICGSSKTILLCIVGELAVGGSVSVAFGVSNIGQLTVDM